MMSELYEYAISRGEGTLIAHGVAEGGIPLDCPFDEGDTLIIRKAPEGCETGK